MTQIQCIRGILQDLSDDQLKKLQEKLIDYDIPTPQVLVTVLEHKQSFTLCGSVQKDFLRELVEVLRVEQMYDLNDMMPYGELAKIMSSKSRLQKKR